LMSEYAGGIFLGFSVTMPRGILPDRLYFSLFCPSLDADDMGRVEAAPYGTRKLEAALLNHGFRREDVIVAHPDYLDRIVGPRTKVIGITAFDPLGMGPATSTFGQIFQGGSYMTEMFKQILDHPSVRRFRPKIVVGGPGAWQLENDSVAGQLGVDHVVLGEGENVVPSLFGELVRGTEVRKIVRGGVVSEAEIPTITEPTVHGIVEIARGCGRGCAFCVPNLQRYRCLPIDHILKEVEVNLRAGRQPLLHAEDVLRYGARGFEVNKQAVVGLFATLREHPGVDRLSISHFSLSSVANAPDVIEDISQIVGVGEDTPWFSGQTGIETGSPRMMRRHMRGKSKPFTPEDWPDVVIDAFRILSENRWVPCATLIMGLPHEENDDVDLTIRLVERLREFKSLIVPLFYVAEGAMASRSESFTLEHMSPLQGELFAKCWRHNLGWVPILLEEYSQMHVKDMMKRYALKFILSRAMTYADRLLSTCEREYNYDLKQMIEHIRAGETKMIPKPLRVVEQLQRISRVVRPDFM